jgi:hypothetical protein
MHACLFYSGHEFLRFLCRGSSFGTEGKLLEEEKKHTKRARAKLNYAHDEFAQSTEPSVYG